MPGASSWVAARSTMLTSRVSGVALDPTGGGELRARAEITSHFAAGPQARWRGASDELYPGRYVRSEQQSQRACGPQPAGARRRAGICFVAAPRRCPTSPSSRRLASARPALAPKCEFISARALGHDFINAATYSAEGERK